MSSFSRTSRITIFVLDCTSIWNRISGVDQLLFVSIGTRKPMFNQTTKLPLQLMWTVLNSMDKMVYDYHSNFNKSPLPTLVAPRRQEHSEIPRKSYSENLSSLSVFSISLFQELATVHYLFQSLKKAREVKSFQKKKKKKREAKGKHGGWEYKRCVKWVHKNH